MPQRLLVAAAVLAALLPSAHATPKALPAESPQAAQDLAMEQAEERELRAWFAEPALALRADGASTVLRFLQARHPELVQAGVDRDGFLRFLVPAEFAARIGQYRATLTSLGATVGKTLPSPRIQALYKTRVTARRMGEPDVLGLIVKYRDTAKRKRALEATPLEATELERLSTLAGRKLVASRPMYDAAYATRFDGPTDLLSGEMMAQRVAMSPDVERVDLDTRVDATMTPNDEFFALQWSLGTGPGGIRAESAWNVTTGSTSVVVGVVDTGILGHPDLEGRHVQGMDMIASAVNSNDGDGRDGDPTDAGTYGPAGACGTSAVNSSWHGTHVSGIIAANANNGFGIAGIDWKARLLSVRALGRCGSGASSDIIDAIAWAAGLAVPGTPANANPARVINASLGGAGDCSVYHPVLEAALRKGALVIAAAGNDNDNALGYRPASCALALTVSAIGPSGDKAYYSNYSAALEISAPGGDESTKAADGIPSTYATGTQGDPGNAQYFYLQGTSQAAPHVSGVAALMLSVAPAITVAQMRDTIQKTARAYPSGSRCAVQKDCAVGILDAAAAVNAARALNGKSTNYSALWWNSSESGWGVNFQQQGNILFGTWFSYSTDGNPVWLVMPAMNRVTDDLFAGDVYYLTGVPYSQINGQQARLTLTKAAQATVYFFDDDKAFFQVDTDAGNVLFKQMQLQVFAQRPQCDFTTGSRAALSNYQDLWWNPSESGWGINLTHQGNTIFATWFTYANDGSPIWLVADALAKTGPSTYSGSLLATTGKAPATISGSPAISTVAAVGTMSLTFQDGEHGTLSYSINGGASGTKAIQRQVWSSPLSSCH